jgi:ubiquinone/menaquinone biosynthesis C-methylase UbiE
MELTDRELEEKYVVSFAATWARKELGVDNLDDWNTLRLAEKEGVDLYMFKNSRTMPRIKRVLGMLKKVDPEYHLDIGCGRGVFLWRYLKDFTCVDVTVIDLKQSSIDRVNAMNKAGVANCYGYVMDATNLDFEDDHVDFFDCVTALEVLEHIPEYKKAIKEMVRVCKDCIIVSVPSKEDDNPEHIHLFTKDGLIQDFKDAGAKSVKAEYVLNSMILYVKV